MLEVMVLVCTAVVATPLWLGAFWIRSQGRPVVQPPPAEEPVRRPAGAPRRQAATRPPHLGRLIRARRPGHLGRGLARGPRRQSLALPDTVAAARAVPNDPHLAGAFPWPEVTPTLKRVRNRTNPRPPAAARSAGADGAPSAVEINGARRVANPERITFGIEPARSVEPVPAAAGPRAVPPQIDLTDAAARSVIYTAVTSGQVASPDTPAPRAPVDEVLERAGSRAVVATSEFSPRRAARHAVDDPAPAPSGYPSISSILPDPRQGRRRA